MTMMTRATGRGGVTVMDRSFKSFALLMEKVPKLLLTDLFEYWPKGICQTE